MGKTPVDIIKYVIHAEAEAKGLVEKPDIIGAIFGQTEGLLGEGLDLRELQKSGRIGRIEAEVETKSGVTKASITIPSSLDMVETSIIAASVETITRVGPCDASFKIKDVEDIRKAKRDVVVERASSILKQLLDKEIPDAKEITQEVRHEVMGDDAVKYKGLDAGSAADSSESIILVEGRADVMNLLRNGIKNVVAIGGINVTQEIVDICNSKTSTVFVDGDRGGDLIIKSLEKAGAKIDFIARAPKDLEVENLARKDIMMCLRRKVEGSEALAELNEQKTGGGGDTSREQASEAGGYADREYRSRGRPPGGRGTRGRYAGSRSSGDRPPRGRPLRDRPPRDRPPRQYSSSSGSYAAAVVEEKEPSARGALLEKLNGLKNEALLLDESLAVVKKMPLDALGKQKIEGYALVMDDVVTQKVVDTSKVRYIAAITKANNLKTADMEIFTKF